MKRILITPFLFAMLLGASHYAEGATSFVREDGKRLIDIVISICDSPEGDDDGDTQDANNLSDQDKIEQIIQYFADGIYESTEGMHLLRNVFVYKNKANWHKCDIKWDKKGKNLETTPAISLKKQIKMFYLSNGLDILASDKNRMAAGHDIIHEWGHYFYGLYDEYNTFALGGAWPNVDLEYYDCPVPSLMNSPYSVVETQNYKYLNFSVRYRGGPSWIDEKGNPRYGEFENTQKTAQHFMFGKSAWETLSDPDTSDSNGMLHAIKLGKRAYYPELATVAPVGNNLPRTDLVWGGPYPSRDALKIHWITAKSVVQIVIDCSGSMEGQKLRDIKQAAKVFIDLVNEGTSVGIVSYNGTAIVNYPITIITGEPSRQALYSAINGLTADGGNNESAAMRLALTGIQNFGATNRVAAVFLFTDGGVEWAPNDPQNLINEYSEAGIPIYTFGGAHVLSEQTGGSSYSGLSRSDIYQAIVSAYMEVSYGSMWFHFLAPPPMPIPPNPPFFSPLADNSLASISSCESMSLTESLHCPFLVDSSMTNLFLYAIYMGSATNATLQLRAPDNSIIFPTVNVNDGGVLLMFNQTFPEPGEWILEGMHDADMEFTIFACAMTESDFWFHVSAPEQDNDNVWVLARLERDGAISGMHVTGKLEMGGEIMETKVFDEVMPGRYVAQFNRIVGEIEPAHVTVTIDNSLGQGVETWKDFDEENEEEEEEWADIPMPANFLRIETVDVNMRKQLPTDHTCTTLYVDASRTNDYGMGYTWATAKKTIQAAVNVAHNNTIIMVTNGVYGAFNVGSKPLIVQSVNGSAVTVIDGKNAGTCAYLNSSTSMTGFTLQNGYTAGNGGGVYSGVLRNCVIRGNVALSGGGAYGSMLYDCQILSNDALGNGGGAHSCTMVNCDMYDNLANNGGGAALSTLTDCEIVENGAYNYGGGIRQCTLVRCNIVGNVAAYFGGGIDGNYGAETVNQCWIEGNVAGYAGGGATATTLNDCVVTNNTANSGGGVSESTVNRCFVVSNKAFSPSGQVSTYGGGIYYCENVNNSFIFDNTADYGGGGYYCSTLRNCTVAGNSAMVSGAGMRKGNLLNCIVWGNTTLDVTNNWHDVTASYTCTTPELPGAGNIEAEPLFFDLPKGDVRLRVSSLCIDAGSNAFATGNTDVAGNPRVLNGRVDMGAHESKMELESVASFALPLTWLDMYWGWQGAKDYGTLAGLYGANGYTLEESYVAGLTPTNPKSIFYAKIAITNGMAYVSWEPDLGDVRDYHLEGTPCLDAPFGPTNEMSRFYRVNVSMPEILPMEK